MLNWSPAKPIVTGDTAAEVRASQVFALALRSAAGAASQLVQSNEAVIPLPPLLAAASNAAVMASVEAPQTPLAILGLGTRSMFELYVRLKHVLADPENSLAWRSEAITDHIEIYEGLLGLQQPEALKGVLLSEVDRIREHAKSMGLSQQRARRPIMRDLAKSVGLEAEYAAFYKCYSKFVHPSSFVINQPTAASTPVFRTALMFNLQAYAYLILCEPAAALQYCVEDLLEDANSTIPGSF